MKKLITIFLSIALLAASSTVLYSCDKDDSKQEEEEKDEKKDKTDDEKDDEDEDDKKDNEDDKKDNEDDKKNDKDDEDEDDKKTDKDDEDEDDKKNDKDDEDEDDKKNDKDDEDEDDKKTDKDSVGEWIDDNGDAFISDFESGFESSGMDCTTTVKAKGSNITITVCIDGFDNVPDESKEAAQDSLDESYASIGFDDLKAEYDMPDEIKSLTLDLCEEDGDVIASYTFDKNSNNKQNDSDAVDEWIDDKGDVFISDFESGFATSGMDCTTTIKAKGSTIILTVCIDGFDNVPDESKEAAQDSLDGSYAALDLDDIKAEYDMPDEIKSFTLDMCEEDGDVIASYTFN